MPSDQRSGYDSTQSYHSPNILLLELVADDIAWITVRALLALAIEGHPAPTALADNSARLAVVALPQPGE